MKSQENDKAPTSFSPLRSKPNDQRPKRFNASTLYLLNVAKPFA